MLRVGLTGGYATGKSFVAAELEELGCHVIYADRLGHQTLMPDGEAYSPVVSLFGSRILDSSGTIDRKKLGALVFNSPDLLQQLSQIVHPAVFKLEEEAMNGFSQQDPRGIAVVEAAILIETGRWLDYDRLMVTVCSLETQVTRGMKRDGLTREQVLQRVNRQMPLEEKRRLGHYVVDTDGPKESTIRQVREIFRDLKTVAVQNS